MYANDTVFTDANKSIETWKETQITQHQPSLKLLFVKNLVFK